MLEYHHTAQYHGTMKQSLNKLFLSVDFTIRDWYSNSLDPRAALK